MFQTSWKKLLAPLMIAISLVSCGTSRSMLVEGADSLAVEYFPTAGMEWATTSPEANGWDPEALEEFFEFARTHNSSGVVILQGGRVLAQRKWQLEDPPMVANIGYRDVWYHGNTPDGWAREDVASTQKSIISILAGIARDKGLLDIELPVSTYLGEGWSQATREEEADVTVRHLLSMTAGLSETLEFVFPAGEDWSYINKAYSLVFDVLQAATGREMNDVMYEWLTGPLGMTQTEWILRSEFFRQWNMNGLVTTAPDLARLGLMVQAGGQWNGESIISAESLRQALSPSSEFNPAYGFLWWLNNPEGWRWVRGLDAITPGKLNALAPPDMVAAMGTSERRCYVVPSLELVITRTGSTWKLDEEGNMRETREFEQEFWTALSKAMPASSHKSIRDQVMME